MRARRRAGRHGGAAERTVFQRDIDLDRRIAPAVEDLAGDDVGDVGHGSALWLKGQGRSDGLAASPPNANADIVAGRQEQPSTNWMEGSPAWTIITLPSLPISYRTPRADGSVT